MNAPFRPLTPQDRRRRAQLYRLLVEICEDLAPTKEQFERARCAYEAVAAWIAGSDDPLLASPEVYLHGSGGLGTTIKPIGRMEFDIDLICLLLGVSRNTNPAAVKAAVGRRLREHGRYAQMLEEKKRCWRLNYAGEFHLDLSPTIANILCPNGGELVPDRALSSWHPTNPRGYRRLFEKRAALSPRIIKRFADAENRAEAEPFPATLTLAKVLNRVVQILKRHRDVHFLQVQEDVAPISIIITTLAMRAYEAVVLREIYEDELDVLIATTRAMPHFIERPVIDGRPAYAIWNETTQGENFADRWNREPERAKAFFAWHTKALEDLEALRDASGLDRIRSRMEVSFGQAGVRVMNRHQDTLSDARKSGQLWLAPSIGLTTTPAPSAAPVLSNTFFGD
jgi:hypothetical protein